MLLWLAFEWGGSLLLRRPVAKVLVGWHVERGYLWPYVLLTYLLSPLAVGVLIRPAPSRRGNATRTTSRRGKGRRPAGAAPRDGR